MNLEKLTHSVCRLCEETGLFLREEATRFTRTDIREKSHANYVTYIDEQAELRLKERLSELLPGSGFIAEESEASLQGEFTWIIDPLDGTTNYIHGIPVYCISVGLLNPGEAIAGVVYEVGQREMFYTCLNSPARLNGKTIRVSVTPDLRNSLFATGFPYYDYSRLDEYLAHFRFLLQHTRGIRRLGSAAADLAYVACGRLEGFYEYGLHPWDVAAGSLLVRQAGGVVCDFSEGEDYLFGKEIVATNGLIHRSFMESFRIHFK